MLKACEQPSNFKFLYPLDRPIEEKIETIAKEIYHAGGVEFLPEAKEKVERYRRQGEWLGLNRSVADSVKICKPEFAAFRSLTVRLYVCINTHVRGCFL